MNKPVVLLIIIAFVLVTLQGCSNNPGAKDKAENSSANSGVTAGSVDTSNKVVKNDDYLQIDIGNGDKVLYTYANGVALKLIDAAGTEKLICGDLPSEPSISADNSKIAYLSPFEWEVLSDIHIYTIKDGKDEIAVSQKDLKDNKSVKAQNTPKKLVWLDDRYILVIIQFAYGTVARGGDLFIYDTVGKTMQPLTNLDNTEQIGDVRVIGKNVSMNFIKFTDENMTAAAESIKVVTVKEIYDTIANRKLLNFK